MLIRIWSQRNPTRKWMLNEVWNQQVWGSPDLNEVQVQPALNEFLTKMSGTRYQGRTFFLVSSGRR